MHSGRAGVTLVSPRNHDGPGERVADAQAAKPLEPPTGIGPVDLEEAYLMGLRLGQDGPTQGAAQPHQYRPDRSGLGVDRVEGPPLDAGTAQRRQTFDQVARTRPQIHRMAPGPGGVEVCGRPPVNRCDARGCGRARRCRGPCTLRCRHAAWRGRVRSSPAQTSPIDSSHVAPPRTTDPRSASPTAGRTRHQITPFSHSA